MNTIASFRLCKLSNKELAKRVDAHCDNMYEYGRIPLRNVPARPDEDFDLLIGELLCRFSELTKDKDEVVA